MALNDTPPQLSPQKQQFLEALMLGNNIQDAAEQVGISKSTAHRWYKDTEFQGAMQKAGTESLDRVLRILSTAGTHAVRTLLRCTNTDVPPSVQVRAALGILEQCIKLKEYRELEERLSYIEARLNSG